MPGFTWAVYTSDDGFDYLMKVDLDNYVQLARGWTPPIPDSYLPQYPRGWEARHVTGLGPEGQRRQAICATVTCDLWTGVVGFFEYRDTNGLLVPATVIQRIQEQRIRARY